MDTIKLEDINGIYPFLMAPEETYEDIEQAHSTYTHSQLISKINTVLPPRYLPFIHHWRLTRTGTAITNAIWRSYRTLLLQFTEDNKEQWQSTKDKPKDTPKDNNNNYGNSKDKSKPSKPKRTGTATNTPLVTCTHCGHSGHSINTCRYVGKPDTPKCTFCTSATPRSATLGPRLSLAPPSLSPTTLVLIASPPRPTISTPTSATLCT
jgi:hypothetical protein